MKRSAGGQRGWWLVGLLSCCGVSWAGDPLLAVVDGDRVVFTNTPSRADARPVPGVSAPVASRPARLPTTLYDPFIDRAARENRLSPQLIKAVAVVESGLNPHAVSVKGAQGLMQLMPETARMYGVSDAFDPLENLRAGSRLLRDLLDRFDGDLTLALAAYNAGPGAVRSAGGVPDYPETREYIRRIRQRLGRRGDPASQAARPTAPPARIRPQRLADGTLLLTN